MSEQIKEPSHYASATGQAWDVLDVWFANDPLLWNCGKYLARAGKKGDKLTDLLKAQSYLQRRIEQLQREKEQQPTAQQVYDLLKATDGYGDIGSRPMPSIYPPHDAWERK